MSAQIPKDVAESSLNAQLAKAGLTRIHQGKVRDTWALPDHSDLLLQVATNRISIFDFVLNAQVPRKGEVLTAMTVFWLTQVVQSFRNHLVSFGSGIDRYLPENLRDNNELQRCALIVEKLTMIPAESIIRGALTGSGWTSYQESGQVCGIPLPSGLNDGDLIPDPIFPLFAPSDKAEVGHDEHISATSAIEQFGRPIGDIPRAAYLIAFMHAYNRGVLLADTKLELGKTSGGIWTIADEIFTPDSSRFWDLAEWLESRKKGFSPTSWDKQSVRDAGKIVETPFGVTGINKLKPENPDHVAFVHQVPISAEVIGIAEERYATILQRLVEMSLSEYQEKAMLIAA
jgi:phosphoribosylaminoimidazole-succinocarboxamide synthase